MLVPESHRIWPDGCSLGSPRAPGVPGVLGALGAPGPPGSLVPRLGSSMPIQACNTARRSPLEHLLWVFCLPGLRGFLMPQEMERPCRQALK